MVAIRHAEQRDIPWLLQQLNLFCAFYGPTIIGLMPGREIAEAKLTQLMTSHVLLVAEIPVGAVPDDETIAPEMAPIGLIGGVRAEQFLNPAIIQLYELFWWVSPEHQKTQAGGRAGLMLLDAFVEWGNANANWTTFALLPNSPVREEHLTRRGFHLSEHSYLREAA